MGFISKFILPKEIDFDSALQTQAGMTRMVVEDLHKTCINNDMTALNAITTHSEQARELKSKNMKELLDVFITPYDKESIYRIITQLDWIGLSVRHFKLEITAYGISSIHEYQPILEVLVKMATLLEQGITHLASKNPKTIAPDTELIHDKYDLVVTLCAQSVAHLLQQEDYKLIIMHRDILAQLKEIAKRIHITANTLEDMAIKVT